MESFQPCVIVDSGAYSAYHRGQPIDIEEYIAWVHRVIHSKRHKSAVPVEYVNLDVLGLSEDKGTKRQKDTGADSYGHWVEMRRNGLNPLPVWHLHTDVKWLKKYLSEVDHISISISGNADRSRLGRLRCFDRVWEDYLTDSDGNPTVRVHAMGVTSFPLISRYPWFSVDSTSHLQPAIYGNVFMPYGTKRGKAWVWDYHRQPYLMGVSTQSGKLGAKGRHVVTFCDDSKRREMVDAYLEDCGFEMGAANPGEPGYKPGVCNDYLQRAHLNMLFFANYIHNSRGTCAWPRLFTRTRGGLLGVEPKDPTRKAVKAGGIRYTRMYFSGELPVENFMRERGLPTFENCGVMLTYFTQRTGEGGRPGRRLRALKKGIPYVNPIKEQQDENV